MANSGNRRTFNKDVQQLYKSIEASTDGQAAIIGFSGMTLRLSLMPKTGFNAHAAFDLIITRTYSYPSAAPDVIFGTPIFHPNIEPRAGYICLSLLSEWQSCFSLLDVVKAVLYLVEHPNFDSPNNSFATLNNASELEIKTKRLLAGLTVNECRFTPNSAWCEWAIKNNCLPTEDDEGETEKPDPQNGLCSKGLRHPSYDVKVVQHKSSTSSISSTQIEEFDELSEDELSVCTSETVPSFAKIRYSISGDEESQPHYGESYNLLKATSHRIAITQPASEQKVQQRTVYYFAEMCCLDHHYSELGIHFFTLFAFNYLPGDEENTELCQNSCLASWNPMFCYFNGSNDCYSPHSSSFNLSELFHIKTQAKKTLTADFCQWAAEDGLGNNMILSGLFFERQRRHSELVHRIDFSSDGNDSSVGFHELFNLSSTETLSCDKTSDLFNSDQEADSEISELEDEMEKSVDEDGDNNLDNRTSSDLSNSTTSYMTYQNVYPQMHECRECSINFHYGAEPMNRYLGPQPKWLFRQTRWPIRFAPHQTAMLSMENIRIPPWRVSNARLLADVCWYCKKYTRVTNLVLLDPMALSPMSPLLNLMHYDGKSASQLTGVLWMTPLEAISPFYRVPIPTHPPHRVEEGEDVTYPRPFNLRLLTLGAFVTNWVAWLSRMETYNSTGLTRFSPLLITDSVAACYLQLLSLGCGQAPVADLWPLWLLRRLLTTCLGLSNLNISLSFLHSAPLNSHFSFFFPFSDIDEI